MKILIIVFAALILFGCSDRVNEKFPFTVQQKNGSGISTTYTFLKCDSATMISQHEAIAYVKKTRIKIIADQITISSNTYLK